MPQIIHAMTQIYGPDVFSVQKESENYNKNMATMKIETDLFESDTTAISSQNFIKSEQFSSILAKIRKKVWLNSSLHHKGETVAGGELHTDNSPSLYQK